MTTDPRDAGIVPADHHILALACGIVVVDESDDDADDGDPEEAADGGPGTDD